MPLGVGPFSAEWPLLNLGVVSFGWYEPSLYRATPLSSVLYLERVQPLGMPSMKIMLVQLALTGLLFTPSLAGAQSSSGNSVALILVTWVQSKSSEATLAPAQTVIGYFNDIETCIKAAQETRLSNGATALTFNFICVPSK
jgi:hypothetical protein